MKVAVTGGTGFVGSDVVEVLLERGDAVRIITRDPAAVPAQFHGLVETGPWDDPDLSGCDAVVHLAGENLFSHRWNEEQKTRIRKSRIDGTRQVVEAIGRAEPRPRVLVSASAIGYFGPRADEELTETSAPGDDFLAGVCGDWEEASAAARAYGVRVVPLRIGVVLDNGGGALSRMATPFKMFVGGRAGSGRQWVSWVHRRDISRLVVFAIDHDSLDEPLNTTAPNPVRMVEFARTLGHSLGRPSWLPAPSFMLRLALGEVSDLILKGQRVLPKRALELGFEFEYGTLDSALEEIFTVEDVIR